MRAVPAVLALVLILPASVAAQEPPVPMERVIPAGTTAAGLDVGGLTLPEAAAAVDAAFARSLARRVQVRVGERRLWLRPRAVDLVLDAERTARRAYRAARRVQPEPVDVPLAVALDRARLREFADWFDRMTARPARSARLRIGLRRMRLRRARMGRSLDERALAGRLRDVLGDPRARRTLRVWRARVRPQVSTRDLRLRHRTIVTVDRANFRLRLFKRLRFVKGYGIAVGAPGYATPSGRFTIANKAVNPAWHAPDRPWAGAYRNEVVAGGAAENPLKARWLGIVGGVGIHGTAAEYSIGTRASHGCIRMRVADVIDLYPRVPVGTAVLIR